MKTIILANSLIGALSFGLFTYFVEIFENHPNYLKISSYLWSAPLFFFFIIIYIPLSKGRNGLQAFIKHALIGIILTALVYTITLIMYNSPVYIIFLINLIITVLVSYIYLYFLIK